MAKKFQSKPTDKRTASLIEAVTSDAEIGKSGRPKKTEEPLRKFNCKVPVSIYEAFQATSKRKGPTMTWLVVDFMERYVKENRED